MKSIGIAPHIVLLVLLATVLCWCAPISAPAQESAVPTTVSEALEAARQADFGAGADAMEYLRARVLEVQRDPVARNDLANALAAHLGDYTSTYAYKLFACRQLYVIGGSEQVDALIPLLADPSLAHVARYALEVIPSNAINTALWEAMPTAAGPVAAGLASTIAARGGPDAVARLSTLLQHENEDVVAVSIVGLGRLGGADAENALQAARTTLPATMEGKLFEALLGCAEINGNAGRPADAERLYEALLGAEAPDHVRVAAFGGLVAIRGEAASPMIAEALLSGDPVWERTALAHVRRVGGPPSTRLFAQQLALLPPETQALLIAALADRGDPEALGVVAGGLNSDTPAVQVATLDALGVLGDETVVPYLVNAMMLDDDVMARTGRESLVRLADAGTNAVLLALYPDADVGTKAALSSVLADRNAREALPTLLAAAETESGAVQRAAFNAIGQLAGPEVVPALAALFYAAEDEALRADASQTLLEVYRRIPASEARTESLTALYTEAPTALARAGLLQRFRDLGDNALLPIVQEAASTGDVIVEDAAVRALAGWPNAAPVDAVYALATGAASEDHRQVALDGFIRMLRLDPDRPVDASVAGFKKALAISTGPETTRAILAGLAELKSVEALDIATEMLGDAEVHAEAASAAERIRSRFYTLTASVATESAAQAADGSIYSWWQTPGPQEPGQWIEIDLFRRAAMRGVVLDTSRTRAGYPRAYRVYVYEPGGEPGAPVAAGAGTEGVTTIEFAQPVPGRLLRIEQTGTTDTVPWVIHEIRVLPE